jgi:hypothetical protein
MILVLCGPPASQSVTTVATNTPRIIKKIWNIGRYILRLKPVSFILFS